VSGLVCVDKTDCSKELFFSAAGCCYDSKARDVGHSGFYWSSISNNSYIGAAYGMTFARYGSFGRACYPSYNGAPVRGVC
jgi:hypothetical protein